MMSEFIDRNEYREDMRRVEGVIRDGFQQMAVRFDVVGTRAHDTELKVAVLNDRSDRAEQAAKEAAKEVASNTRWAKYVGPVLAMLSGLLSGQWRG